MWRSGLDLHSRLLVPLWDALLGGTVTVTTLRGAASLTIPPGTQHGAVLSLASAGVEQEAGGRDDGSGSGSRGGAGQQAARGSHHFEVCVQLPRDIGGEEEGLLQRLRELQHQQQQQREQRRGAG